jgi:protection-of-telomeres protein 1
MSYVLWANDHVEEIALPSDHEYHERLIQANKPNKDKFSLLKHVNPNHFYDILGEIIKLHDSLQCMTLYLSDYTGNKNFFEYSEGADGIDGQGQEGDEYGYLKPKRKEDWPGPHGKLTIQLTLFDEHAQFVRERVKENTWVLMKNVQIKYGKTGGILEGFMRGDGGKMNVTIVKVPGAAKDLQRSNEEEDLRCKENDDPRFKGAVQRKMDWKKKFEKKHLGKLVESAGPKRKHDDEGPSKSNSKKRREEKRAAGLKKIAAEETKTRLRLNLNENSMCAIFQAAQFLMSSQFGAIIQTNQLSAWQRY